MRANRDRPTRQRQRRDAAVRACGVRRAAVRATSGGRSDEMRGRATAEAGPPRRQCGYGHVVSVQIGQNRQAVL